MENAYSLENKRYGELKKSLGKVTHKMLTEQLREMESHGLLTRTVYQVVPPKVEYSITEFGKTAIPVISSIREWGLSIIPKEIIKK